MELRPPSRADLPRDLVAGVTLGAAQIGLAMANTILAGVPPVHGLYATMVGTPVGALTASTQRMTIVTTSALGLAAGASLAGLPSDQRVAGFFTLAVMAGALMLLAGILRAGGLLRFISDAVMVGFMAGVVVQILLGQLLILTGFASEHGSKVAGALDLAAHPGRIDVTTALVGLAALGQLVLLTRTRLKLFAMAASLVAATATVALLDLSSVPLIGGIAPIPGSLPLPQLPDVSLAPGLLVPALSLAIIALVQGAGVSRSIPGRGGIAQDASGDFTGQGVANIASGLFGGATVGGSVAATAVNVSAGARTRWSSFFAGAFVALVVVLAAPLIELVPQTATAAILIVAAVGAVKPRAALDIWAADKLSAAVMAATFALVLVIPLHYAVLAGAAISVLKHVYLSSLDVRVVQVCTGADGRLREGEAPRALADASVTVLDIYGSLFFAAGPKLRQLLPVVGAARCAIVVLRLRGRGTLHSTSMALIRGYAAELAAGGGRLYLAGVGPEMEQQLRRTGLLDMLGEDAVLQATDEPYGSCESAQMRARAWLKEHPAEPLEGPAEPHK